MTDSHSPRREIVVTRTVQALAVIVVAGGAGFLAHRLTASHTSVLPVATSSAPARPSPVQPPPPPPAPKPIPDDVPEIALTDTAGVRRKLSEWKGHPILINFWATWCEPCRREIPLLQRLRREHAPDGIEVIGIAVDYRDAVLKYAREMHIEYPLLIGEQDGLEAVAVFGMESAFPFTVFADRRARIVTLKVGELHPDEAALILSRLRDVDSGRLGLREAREQIASGIRELAGQRGRSEAQSEPR